MKKKYWYKVFNAVYDGKIDTWDYQWVLASWAQGMVSIIPRVNLVSNIGFGSEATHTCEKNKYSSMDINSIEFPLKHPDIILPHKEADNYTAHSMFLDSLLKRVLNKINSLT